MRGGGARGASHAPHPVGHVIRSVGTYRRDVRRHVALSRTEHPRTHILSGVVVRTGNAATVQVTITRPIRCGSMGTNYESEVDVASSLVMDGPITEELGSGQLD